MASYFLPSFLTGWDLSAVSAYSLSANLQKRILSYLLKRTLGHLVDGGHLDLAQIDAGIGSGRIEVRNIQLHAEAINRQLPSIPFTLVSGEIGRILIQLPVPNFWSGELSVTVSDIKVNIKPLPQGTTQAFTTKDDLAASFASAASQIFVEDEEAKEIEESIHESLASEDDANAQQHAKEESGSLIATYVEALLTRLKVTIDHVHVKLDCDTIDLSLKLESATVHSSNARSEQRAPSSDDDSSHSKSHNRRLMSETARTLQLQGFELWLEDKRKPKNTYDHYSSSSSEASSDDFTGEESQEARQQLEESVASLQESSASLYESAVGSSAFHDAPESHGDALPRPPTTRSAHSIEPTQRHLLFSLGQEAVVVTLKTVKERQEMIPTGSTSRRAVQRLVSITTDVDVQIGHAGAIVFIDHASPLMTIARRLAHSMPSRVASQSENTSKAERSPPPRNPSVQRKLELSCHVSSLNVIVGYEASTLDGQVQSSIDAFWFRPSRSHPDFGHLRLRCDKLSAHFTNNVDETGSSQKQPEINLQVGDLGIFEHLSSNVYEQCPTEASRVLPVLVLDPNLCQSEEADAKTAKHYRHDYARSTIDVFDWRYSSAHPPTSQRHVGSAPDSEGSPRTARFKSSEARSTSSSSGANPYHKIAYGDRGWKLKPHSKPHSTAQGHAPDSNTPNIAVNIMTAAAAEIQGCIEAQVAPIHCFVDVSLVTRLMPALRRFAATQLEDLQEEEGTDFELTDSIATLSNSLATLHTSAHDLLHDLGETPRAELQKSVYTLDLKINFVRIELRTPKVSFDFAALAGRDQGLTRLSGLDRRSGILVLQVQSLKVQSGLAEREQPSGGVRFAQPAASDNRWQAATTVVTARINAEKISAFLALPGESRALVLALIEASQDEDTMPSPFASSPMKLLPQVQLSRSEEVRSLQFGRAVQDNQAKDRCSASIPSIKVELGKDQLDSLQYMADDLTQSINLWSSDDLDDGSSVDAEGLKILGSRFFGSRAGMSVMSASTDSTATATARASTRNSSLGATITKASIRLWLPDLRHGKETSGRSKQDPSKSLLLMASDFELSFDSDKIRNINRIEIRVPCMQLSVESRETGGETSSFLLASRTVETGLDSRGRNMVLLVLEAYAEPGTSYREQNVDLTLCLFTLSPPFDDELIPRVKRLLKAPAGVFENVEPNEVTRISFKAKDCSIYIAPPNTSHRASVAIGEASVKTKLTSHAPKTAVKLAIGNLDFFAIDSEASPARAAPLPMIKSASEHWVSKSYARIVHVPESKGSIHFNALTRPEVDVKITKLRVKLQVAADTLDVVIGVLAAAATATPTSASVPSSPESTVDDSFASPMRSRMQDRDYVGSPSRAPVSPTSMKKDRFNKMADLMSDIEDDAYRLATPIHAGADLVDDDVPTDAAFLGAKGRYHPEIVETTLDSDEFFGGESVASLSLLAPRTDTVIFADEDVTIRLLDPKGICPVKEYFTNPDLQPHADSVLGTTASSVRVRISNFDLSMRLHSGYDWASTRKSVEQETKLVRKRLQKIKQLLAEGQVPDDSVEAATSNLLDSIHISLPHEPSEMGPEDMLKAVEDELGEDSDAASTADSDTSASWQALPTARQGQHASRVGASAKLGAAGSSQTKLHRSSRSLIDFNFRGLEVEFDKADPSQASNIVTRIAVNARRFEIIDNIKTSTWRTFLTEMQDRNAAPHHDAESKMVKVEILNVRPAGGPSGDSSTETPEVRLRAKISPLRLHVDQDALDFLKKFFTFKPPGQKASPPAEQSPGPALPFVQFAEVLPIKIKLDYKPKRVDYNLLRQGKTIELMNFFHFEGSEMVLRHITLRGINGWARLFDTLNDIWTPDVKANQLADFLAGLGPVRSLVNVGAGLADLVLLPLEQYHKDGRVLRGMQKGATSFAKSTALEAVKLGARLATGTQVILEQAEHILGGEMSSAVTARAVGPDNSTESYESLSESIMVSSMSSDAGASWEQEENGRRRGRGSKDQDSMVSRYATQPDNMRDALSQAYSGLTEGLTSAAQTILAIPMEVYEPDSGAHTGAASGTGSGGAASASRPVVKAVPIAILRGARGATQAIAKTMQGVQVSLGDSENVKEGKYKQPASRR